MTLHDCWTIYVNDVVPPGAHAIQIQECRRSFYAGAWAVLTAHNTVAEEKLSEEVQRLYRECEEFKRLVLVGGA